MLSGDPHRAPASRTVRDSQQLNKRSDRLPVRRPAGSRSVQGTPSPSSSSQRGLWHLVSCPGHTAPPPGVTRDEEGQRSGVQPLLTAPRLTLSLSGTSAFSEQLLWLALPPTQRSGRQNGRPPPHPRGCSRRAVHAPGPLSGLCPGPSPSPIAYSLSATQASRALSHGHVHCTESPGDAELTQEASAPLCVPGDLREGLRSGTTSPGLLAPGGHPFKARGSGHQAKPNETNHWSVCGIRRVQGTRTHSWTGTLGCSEAQPGERTLPLRARGMAVRGRLEGQRCQGDAPGATELLGERTGDSLGQGRLWAEPGVPRENEHGEGRG